MTPRRAAGLVIVRSSPGGNRFLLLRNARHGTWGFPKGHVEPGESLLDCARRECREETGLSPAELVGGFERKTRYRVRDADDREQHKEVVYYLARVAADSPVVMSCEHDAAVWAALPDALTVLQFEDLKSILRAAACACGEENW